jgi:hypothetical protein
MGSRISGFGDIHQGRGNSQGGGVDRYVFIFYISILSDWLGSHTRPSAGATPERYIGQEPLI